LTGQAVSVKYASLLEEGKERKTFFNNLLEAISVGVGGRVNCKSCSATDILVKSNIETRKAVMPSKKSSEQSRLVVRKQLNRDVLN
jgi:hypothetical protein